MKVLWVNMLYLHHCPTFLQHFYLIKKFICVKPKQDVSTFCYLFEFMNVRH